MEGGRWKGENVCGHQAGQEGISSLKPLPIIHQVVSRSGHPLHLVTTGQTFFSEPP